MKKTHTAFTVLFAASLMSLHGQSLIVNGGFDAPDIMNQAFQTYTNSPPGFVWTITPSGDPNPAYDPTPPPEFCCALPMLGIDLCNTIWPGTGGTTNSDTVDQSVDIDGDSGISQSFATVAGEEYKLTLHYTSHPRFPQFPNIDYDMIGYVSVDGGTNLVSATLIHNTPNYLTNMEWMVFSETFVADSTVTTLTLTGDSSNAQAGFVVDNVSVVPLRPRLDIRVSQVELCWHTEPNAWYQLQYRSTLTTNEWVPLTGTWVAGDGARYCTNDTVLVGNPQRFYQLSVTNSPPQ